MDADALPEGKEGQGDKEEMPQQAISDQSSEDESESSSNGEGEEPKGQDDTEVGLVGVVASEKASAPGRGQGRLATMVPGVRVIKHESGALHYPTPRCWDEAQGSEGQEEVADSITICCGKPINARYKMFTLDEGIYEMCRMCSPELKRKPRSKQPDMGREGAG